jgi:hypothetical protein
MVVMSLEIRDLDADKMQQVFDLIKAEADKLGHDRSTPIQFAEPKEFTSAEDMANGASVLFRTVLAIDDGALN